MHASVLNQSNASTGECKHPSNAAESAGGTCRLTAKVARASVPRVQSGGPSHSCRPRSAVTAPPRCVCPALPFDHPSLPSRRRILLAARCSHCPPSSPPWTLREAMVCPKPQTPHFSTRRAHFLVVGCLESAAASTSRCLYPPLHPAMPAHLFDWRPVLLFPPPVPQPPCPRVHFRVHVVSSILHVLLTAPSPRSFPPSTHSNAQNQPRQTMPQQRVYTSGTQAPEPKGPSPGPLNPEPRTERCAPAHVGLDAEGPAVEFRAIEGLHGTRSRALVCVVHDGEAPA